MRYMIPLVALIAVAGCSQSNPSSPTAESLDVSEQTTATVSAPGISPTAAPGVAFNYRYAFRLPAQRVATVQEEHAQACEKLGLGRCRITGMRYRLVGQKDIEAMLAFKLDPTIARQFGKAGIEAVGRAEGMLVDSEITGEDAGSAIKLANRNETELNAEIVKIEAQISRKGVSPGERAELQSQLQQLRQSVRANRANREDQQESLAVTPVVFRYGSGNLVPGFDTRSPIRNALEQAGNNFIGGVAILFVILVTLLPWALLLALAWWIVRRFSRLRFRMTKVPPQTAETAD